MHRVDVDCLAPVLASTPALAARITTAAGTVVADVPYMALDRFETDTPRRLYYKVTGMDGAYASGDADLPAVAVDLGLVRVAVPTRLRRSAP